MLWVAVVGVVERRSNEVRVELEGAHHAGAPSLSRIMPRPPIAAASDFTFRCCNTNTAIRRPGAHDRPLFHYPVAITTTVASIPTRK